MPDDLADESSQSRRSWYWYDEDIHRFVGPVSWALMVDGEPIEGYSIVSPKGRKLDVYGRTDEVGVEMLSRHADTGDVVDYVIADDHNLSRGHEVARDVDVRDGRPVKAPGESLEWESSPKGKHDGRGRIKNLRTARAVPDPNVLRDRFDRRFAFRVKGQKSFALTPDVELDARGT